MVKLLSPTSLSKSRRRTSPRRKTGGRPKKGSKEAKEMMARVRAAKKGGKGKKTTTRKSPTRKMRSPTTLSMAKQYRHHGKMHSPTAVASPTTLSAKKRKTSRKTTPKRKTRKGSPKRK